MNRIKEVFGTLKKIVFILQSLRVLEKAAEDKENISSFEHEDTLSGDYYLVYTEEDVNEKSHQV